MAKPLVVSCVNPRKARGDGIGLQFLPLTRGRLGGGGCRRYIVARQNLPDVVIDVVILSMYSQAAGNPHPALPLVRGRIKGATSYKQPEHAKSTTQTLVARNHATNR